MHIVQELIVMVLTAYLALSHSIAGDISSWFSVSSTQTTDSVLETVAPGITPLPTKQQTIPDILLQSAAYQQATVGSAAGLSGATTDNPLDAIVNIYCTLTTDEHIRTTTGTGFFIDPDGIIMTNAHVAQFLLLEKTDQFGATGCTIRSGDPATALYRAELLYLSPSWIQENAGVMHQSVPMGTGERDYALLYVSESIDKSPLPAIFPALSFDSDHLPLSVRGDAVLAAGYPATNLLESGPSAVLAPKQATTTISELYTFGSNYADVFSVRGSSVGAEGTSGGPILNEQGNVIGMIVTRGDDQIDGNGSLRAITFSHIEQTIKQETSFTLADNLSGNLPYRANIFAETISPFLITLLEQAN